MIKVNSMAKEPSRGIFWVIDGRVEAYPFNQDTIGVAKSGNTYNHKELWKSLNRKKPYNYYPRGRVEFTNKGKPIIYINPNVDEYDIKEIRKQFGIREDPIIRVDNSEHYRCYLDDGWVPDN